MSTPDFQNLVLNHAEQLKPFAIGLTRDQEKAKDLCQETLYKAFAYSDKYHPDTNIKAWLYTIMRNIFINDYRRNNHKNMVYKQMEKNHYENSSEQNVRIREINEVLYNMPSIFKTCCILYLQGYKYHEIAFALDEPIGTIKSRIHFAKKIMQRKLER
jgi:RNA polymerase sigma factor (sigma-70 family)